MSGVRVPPALLILSHEAKKQAQTLGAPVWSQLFAQAQLAPKLYLQSVEYPDEEAIALVQGGRATLLAGRLD